MINFDPRTKVVLVLLISSAAVIIEEIKPLFLLLALTSFLCRLFSVSLLRSMKKLKKVLSFFFILALVQSVFTSGGEVLVSIGSLRILTTVGLESGISIMIRMAIIICSALIIASAPILKVVYGLIAMKLPYEIAFMVLLSIKFLPLFKEEFVDAIIAVQLAGADLGRIPLKKKLSLYTDILTPTVIKALNRARFISLSMEGRGFRAYPTRTAYCKLQMNKPDYFTLLGAAALIVMIISINYSIIS